MLDIGVALTEHLRQAASEPFVWSKLNCWFWVADWVALRTGIDPAADLRGSFDDEFQALRVLRRRGARDALDMAQIAAERCQLTAIDPRAACAGDVAAVRKGRGLYAGAICTGARWAIKTKTGLWWGSVASECIPLACTF